MLNEYNFCSTLVPFLVLNLFSLLWYCLFHRFPAFHKWFLQFPFLDFRIVFSRTLTSHLYKRQTRANLPSHFQMDQLLAYLVFFSSIIFVLFSRRVLFYFSRWFHKFFDLNSLWRRLFYYLPFRRLNGSTNLPTYLLLIILLLFGLNIFALLFRHAGHVDIAHRAAWLSHLVLIYLSFGSSSSLIAQKLLGLYSEISRPLHNWLGRLYLINILVHSFLQLALRKWEMPSAKNLVVSRCPTVELIS